MRKSNIFFAYIIFNIMIIFLIFVHAYFKRKADIPILNRKIELVKKFELTDLCLFTEARYTRHPSQADLHTPFQDYPLSFEHFPSGSLVMPPAHTYAEFGIHYLHSAIRNPHSNEMD